MYSDPSGECIIVAALIGAAISVAVNGINNAINHRNFFQGAGGAAITGFIGGFLSAGIGTAVGNLGKFAKFGVQTIAHANLGCMMTSMSGGNYWHGFASGAIASAVTSGVSGMFGATNPWRGVAMVGAGGLSGGVGSVIAGGNFWDGARNGLISAGLNHVAHYVQSSIEAGLQVKAVRTFLKDLGFNSKQVDSDVIKQTDSFFGKYYAKLLNAERYISNWGEQVDSRGGVGFVSGSKYIMELSSHMKSGVSYSRKQGYRLKYYPNRANSIGLIRANAGHYSEAFLEVLDGQIRNLTGHDNVIYNMHDTNAYNYLEFR